MPNSDAENVLWLACILYVHITSNVTSMSNTVIYAFGYNAFNQVSPYSPGPIDTTLFQPKKITGITKVLFSTWGLTVGLNEQKKCVRWGLDGQTSKKREPPVPFLTGDITKCIVDKNLAVWLDQQCRLWYHDRCLSSDCIDFAYCKLLDIIFWIDGAGKIQSLNPISSTSYPLHVSLNTSKPFQRFTKLASSESNILALTEMGDIYSWGTNRFSQLGHGHTQSLSMPTIIEALEGIRVKDIGCGAFHSMALSEDGDLYAFGWNHFGRLGIGEVVCKGVPQLVEFIDENGKGVEDEVIVRKFSCGGAHSIVIDDSGSVWVCGWGKYGQLGFQPPSAKDEFFFPVFRRHRDFGGNSGREAIDCIAGFWETFITTNTGDDMST